MVGARAFTASRAAVAGIICLIIIQLMAKPDDWLNWVGALTVSATVAWFVLEVFEGPKIVDDRIVAQDLFLEVLSGQEGDEK